jgi:hypothetical protein
MFWCRTNHRSSRLISKEMSFFGTPNTVTTNVNSHGSTQSFCQSTTTILRVQLKRDGTRWRTEGNVKGKLANGVGSQHPSHYLGTWCIQHYYLSRTVPDMPTTRRRSSPWLLYVILHVISKNGGKTEFYRNGFLATLGSTFQEGQN